MWDKFTRLLSNSFLKDRLLLFIADGGAFAMTINMTNGPRISVLRTAWMLRCSLVSPMRISRWDVDHELRGVSAFEALSLLPTPTTIERLAPFRRPGLSE
jgi:hypothetical protein